MVDIRMPDGAVVRFPDELTDQQIRSLILRRYPRLGEAPAAGEQPGRGVAERRGSGERGMEEAVAGTDAAEGAGPSEAIQRGALPIGEFASEDPRQPYEVLAEREAEHPNRFGARLGYGPDFIGQAGRLPAIDPAKLITALIKANGGKAFR